MSKSVDSIADFLMLDPATRAKLAPELHESIIAAKLTESYAPEFQDFKKIPRLNRECLITEKLDGTNGVICIMSRAEIVATVPPALAINDDWALYAGSRSRWVTPLDDNYGFAKWVCANAEELLKLGSGYHYGEWWGGGVQRGYGLKKDDKRFSLFNAGRWNAENVPACVGVVPVLYQGLFTTYAVNAAIERLRGLGSKAAPGFMKPEGIVVYHTHANQYFKVTLEKDEKPKGQAA